MAMDAASPTKEKVTLVGFSPKLEDRTLRGQRSANNGGITITVNGTTNPRNDESPTQPERVTLIGFSRSESFNTPHNTRPMNFGPGFGSNSASELERQERLNRLTERTREWFSKMRQENEAEWPGGDGAFLQNSERMRMFFEEAHAKFHECSNDRFDQFVQDNQERFTQMLEMHNLLRPFNARGSFTPNGNVSNPHGFSKTKYNFCSAASGKTSGIGTDMDNISPLTSRKAYSGSTTPNGPTGFPKFPTYSGMSSDSSSNHNQSRNFSPPASFLHSFDSNFNQNGDTFSKCRTEFGTNKAEFGGNSHFGSFPSFPTFPTFPTFASVPSTANTFVTKVNASRSTFEYCGNTDTYRFSTEEVSQEFGQSFDTVSESDDDEDDEEETSTCGDPSEYGDESSAVDSANSDSGSLLAIEYDNKLEKINNTLHKIANELLTTERSYVHVLHLIDQVFYFRVDNENRAHNMFAQDIITQMFSNIKSIYKLHHDFLLPQLEQRMANWEQERRIGDIMKNFAPFLKMYTEYVKNFDNAMNTINCCASKVTRFANILEEIQKMPECGCLTMQHHMLVPIQRVPRYELLLKDYLKKLPEDSPDRADTEKALHLVSTAANHSNDAMKKIDKFKKLLEIQDMIGGSMDLVSPTRELVKEGKIIKISNRSGDHQERHLFLFNDMLLLCSQRLIANRVVSGPCFKVRAKLDVDSLQILEGDNIETANTFYIRNNQKTIELYTQTPEEKEDWMQALCKVVQDLYKRKSSLKIGAETLKVHDADLGRRAPTFLKMDTIGACMNCSTQFTAFKRRHHCRACGLVVCNKCSSHKLPLVYDDNKANRVCNQCYETLKIQPPDKANTEESEKENIESPIQRKGILEVKASDDCVLSSYLHLKTRGKTWIKRWFTLHKDFVLYSFKSSEDEQAVTSMPVPGFTVSIPDKSDGIDKENVFKLFHKKKVYYFQAKDKEDLQRWISSLEKASRAELPT